MRIAPCTSRPIQRRRSPTSTTGVPITFSYWNSCSNGGRQGLLEAQRYPSDFDGIVAIAPWVDQTGFTVGAMWNQKALTEAPVTRRQDGARGAEGDGEVRRGGRPEGRAHRRSARVPVRCRARCPGLQRRRGRRRLPDAGAGGRDQQGLQRTGQQRQAVHRRLHARKRSRDDGAQRRPATAAGSAPSCRRSRAPSRRTSIWPKA